MRKAHHKEDADFAAFWAIFPRGDRKIEARYQWRHAAQQFGADRVILEAARYRAETRGRSRDAILPAVAWLAGLTESPDAARGSSPGLDPVKVGSALLTACIISWQLGHRTVAGTVRDYIAPHGPYDAEREFVHRVLLGASTQELITEDEALTWLRARDLPKLDEVRLAP